MSKDTKRWSDRVLTSLFPKNPVPPKPVEQPKKWRPGGESGDGLVALMQFDFVSAEDELDKIVNIYLPRDLV